MAVSLQSSVGVREEVVNPFLCTSPVPSCLKNLFIHIHPNRDNVGALPSGTAAVRLFLCDHVPCRDPDFLEDVEEHMTDEKVHTTAWKIYRSLDGAKQSPSLKEQLLPEEWAFYHPKLERCRRIRDKDEQIKQEFHAYAVRMREFDMKAEEDKLLNKKPKSSL